MKNRSKKYQEAKKQIDKGKEYPVAEALALVKKLSATKFDSSVEAHFRLGLDTKKNEVVRGSVIFPSGTGKTLKICVFTSPDKQEAAKKAGAFLVGGEELIKQIAATKKTDFDVAVASPEIMRPLAKIAKILGQKGLMPNPKSETINPDPAAAVRALNSGKVTFKTDDLGNLHQMIGKVSFDQKKLLENWEILLEAVKKNKPKESKMVFMKAAYLVSTMGPSIKVKI